MRWPAFCAASTISVLEASFACSKRIPSAMGHVQLAPIALPAHQSLSPALLVPISRQCVPPAQMTALNAKQGGTPAYESRHSSLQYRTRLKLIKCSERFVNPKRMTSQFRSHLTSLGCTARMMHCFVCEGTVRTLGSLNQTPSVHQGTSARKVRGIRDIFSVVR